MGDRHIRAEPGPSFLATGVEARSARARAVGPIAAQAFHAGAGVAPGLIGADFDACALDGVAIDSRERWSEVIASGRLPDVRGAFALSWVDREGRLNLARDALGERTLVYAQADGALCFASSLRELLALGGIPRNINVTAVSSYLSTAYVPGRATLVEGVFELLPGEHLQFGTGGLVRRAFWELPAAVASHLQEEELARILRERLEGATRRRLPPGGEAVGAFLSGGLDSSLVVALARRLHAAPVRTYSVHFGADYPNELEHSSLVARHCGTEHTVVELTPNVVLQHLDDAVGVLNDPIGDPLTVPNALLFREAAQNVGVVLNGEGGDPCFGGPKNLPMLLAELYPSFGQASSREANFLRAHLKCFDDLPLMLTDYARDALAAQSRDDAIAEGLADRRHGDFVGRLQAMNITLKGGHHILPKVDALSRPFGVVPRGPLFDRDVVELSMAIPSRLKLNGTIEKYLLKRAVSDLLPESIITRPKSGMLVPVEGWFKGPLLPAARARILDGLAPYGLFRTDYLERLLGGRLGGLRPRHGAKIWLLVTLEAWLRQMQMRA